jgi:pimeloyl-ACP methyl ester carboxylesterase/DNA-binding winged helix-turn-helix (wHTH) protein
LNSWQEHEVASLIFSFEDYELDVERHELRRKGGVQPVEPRVFKLLCFLVEHRHRLVSRDEIFDHIWEGRIVSDTALSSQIKAVRKVIGDDGKAQRLVRTIHGQGFRFVGAANQHDGFASPVVESLAADISKTNLDQEVRFCTAKDGVRIAYAVTGKGKPLVKAANWMSHLDFELQSPIWRHWIAGLSATRELIRYDERGNGMSDRVVDDLSFEAMVTDLETVVDALELERFPLFGISQGCAVSIEYATRHPERVSCLILYGGFTRGWQANKDPLEVGRREAMTTLMRTGWGQDNPAFRQIFTSRFMPEASAEQMNEFNELQRMTVSPENAANFHEVFGAIDVTNRLAEITQPTLVLHAREDNETDFENGRALAAGIPTARFVSLESRNHILFEDEPAFSKLLQEVERFLSEFDI